MGLVTPDDGWRIPDELWEEIEPLLPPRPSHPRGCHRPRVPDRSAMDAILLVLRTGCSGTRSTPRASATRALPTALFRMGSAGVFEQFWRRGPLS